MAGLLNFPVQAWRSRRARLQTPVPPQRGEPGTTGPGDGAPSGAEIGVLTTATQRVRLIIEGPNDPDEAERAIEVLGSRRGWKVRFALPHDRLSVADGRVALVVDALADGQRRTAVGAVRDQAVRSLRKPPVGFRVREAQLVRHEDERGTTLVRVVRRMPQGSGRVCRWLWRHWEAMGGADTGHVLTVPLIPEEDGEQLKTRVKERWADLTHGASAFDEELYDLRLPIGPSPRSGTGRSFSRGLALGALSQ